MNAQRGRVRDFSEADGLSQIVQIQIPTERGVELFGIGRPDGHAIADGVEDAQIDVRFINVLAGGREDEQEEEGEESHRRKICVSNTLILPVQSLLPIFPRGHVLANEALRDHGTDPGQGHQAGDPGAEEASCGGVPVPIASERPSGQARHHPPEAQDRDLRARLLLART